MAGGVAVRTRVTSGTARVELTAAQVRMVNSALAYFQATEHEEEEHYNNDVMTRTRDKVWRAMERAGIEP